MAQESFNCGNASQVRWMRDAAYTHVMVDNISGGGSQSGSWAVSFPRQRGGFVTAQCSGPPGACALTTAHPCSMGSGCLLMSLHLFTEETSSGMSPVY